MEKISEGEDKRQPQELCEFIPAGRQLIAYSIWFTWQHVEEVWTALRELEARVDWECSRPYAAGPGFGDSYYVQTFFSARPCLNLLFNLLVRQVLKKVEVTDITGTPVWLIPLERPSGLPVE